MWIDVGMSAALAVLTIAMAYLGVHVTLHPADTANKRLGYKIGFSTCALCAVALVVWQGVRNGYSQSKLTQQVNSLVSDLSSTRQQVASARVDLQTENIRRQQPEKDLALTVQASGKATRDGVVADIKSSPIKVEVGRGTKSEPGSRHLNGVQSARLKLVFSQIPESIRIRIETIGDNPEAKQYASEINDVVREVRPNADKVEDRIAWEKIPRGLWIAYHDENNNEVREACGKVAATMIQTGIAVMLNPNVSFPASAVTSNPANGGHPKTGQRI